MERHTRQRQAVVDALARSGQALSPQDLLAQAKAAVPRLNLSTVYRQIKGLQDAGQIVRVELPGQPPRFESAKATAAAVDTNGAGAHDVQHRAHAHAPHTDAAPQTQPQHHHHFHCTVCDRVYPIHACPGSMNDLAPPGFQVQHHDLTLRGLCASCVAMAPA